ncbi:hypothetical protein [Novosphingobium sp. PhB57]|uniref:hypothetical protein n=1 Tax=Novosphingobium sp. PhB57 TaxID=2485107 RepID=UPI00104AA091|nr:hypothetical protein [Novosphingobium sp. PhB57]
MNARTAAFQTEPHREFGWNRGQYLLIPAGCRFTGMRNPVAAAQHRELLVPFHWLRFDRIIAIITLRFGDCAMQDCPASSSCNLGLFYGLPFLLPCQHLDRGSQRQDRQGFEKGTA